MKSRHPINTRAVLIFAISLSATAVIWSIYFARGATTMRGVAGREIAVPERINSELWEPHGQSLDAKERIARASPRSPEEWRLLIASVNRASEAWHAGALRAYPASIASAEIAGVHVYVITPASLIPSNDNRLLMHLHGGAYVFLGGKYGTTEAIILAHYARMRVISVDYRMPPSHPFPSALEDSVAVYRRLVTWKNPKNIGLFGASAGGGLTLATVLRLRELHLPQPGAIAPGSPWSDLTKTGDSYFTNEYVDNVILHYDGLLESCALLYANGANLKQPLLSPVYGNYAGFPPAILTTGTRDLFLSNTVRVYRKMRAAGVEARLDVYEAQSHTEYLAEVPGPDTQASMEEIARFLDNHLGR